MRRNELPTPCYVIQEEQLRQNLEILKGVMDRTGCKILLAQKAFSMYEVYPLIAQYLSGTTASGLYEARLGAEEMGIPFGKETHIFSPAYKEEEFDEILTYCDHIVFNSFEQLERFGKRAAEAGKSVGLRINPQYSTQEGHEIYDPCATGSRLGVTIEKFRPELLEYVDGLHFHALCEQDAQPLHDTLKEVERQFGEWLPKMKWLNFGGGHHITREGYDIALLERCICDMKEKYDLEIFLEPGEAVALNAGVLLTKVEEIVENSIQIAILDTSAACHMPDVLEMPYRPPLQDGYEGEEKAYTYRLAGPTCLAGDVIGDYSFAEPLKRGDTLTFEDMAIYTMVKNNTFNGMRLPAIVLEDKDGECRVVRQFGYEDFKMRL
ncbi:carboxynorspermidine decarboxylase [Coprococcus phoceensis]|uniref:carboxynorspermidine decarboxylase n=1 Tax=Coprococcus phoceensis TaxID=1870993 RepID=UPI0008D9475C|nr:carboxynorspermidine decarboxylase [Coprococcus phoceensis]